MDTKSLSKKNRTYLIVFASLMFLTFITVWVSGLDLTKTSKILAIDASVCAIIIALSVASVKGFLVGGYFMHLFDEKRWVYLLILLSVFFFIALLYLPLLESHSRLEHYYVP
ncbi:hypothetical protein AB834_05410 [PVC group bacterium (ex Bugula neritina AB1)]|nr:hypothetical protein AB834_05410 [PVC group bacterium (ex Bugula neritina AB1)]